jgi:hypothetical protein
VGKVARALGLVGIVGGGLGNLILLVIAGDRGGGVLWGFFVVSILATVLGGLGVRRLAERPNTAGWLMLAAAVLGSAVAFQWYLIGAVCFVVAGIMAFRTPGLVVTPAAPGPHGNIFEPVLLPNGNLRIPSGFEVNGMMVDGTREVAPGTEEYQRWLPRVKNRT